MPTYSYLKTDIINTAENDSTEFSDQISYFVERAEERLMKELDDSGLDYYTSVTLSVGNPVVSLPDGALIVRNVNYKTSASSNIKTLLQRPYEYAIDYWGYASASTGTPRYYARKNNTSIYIVPTPASTVTGEIQYTKRPLALSSATGTSATTSNYFSEFCYNALFNACMIESYIFMKSWNTVPIWEAQYKNSIDALRNQARRTRQDDMESAASPIGGPDTIIQGAN
tara:strand:+ start:9595 stop:10275 length:681 start_codon:yes stop_codon:yes gene_type:complete